MKLIVGLGNPGKKYTRNRHNIGFQVIDLLAQRHRLPFDKKQLNAEVASGTIGAERVLLAKPQSYMNESGRPVQGLASFYKIPHDQIIIVVDDLDLPAGQLRLRPEGGSGGQRGMKSIMESLGTDKVARLRIGIGRPPGRMDPAAYVLQDFSTEEETEMAIVRQEAADALELWMVEGITTAMNQFN